MKKYRFWIMILFVIALVGGIYSRIIVNSDEFITYFDMPDEIITYNQGSIKYIKKNSKEYNDIMELVDKRFKKVRKIDVLESSFEPQEEVEIKNKKIVLEFIYNSKRTSKYRGRKYSKLLMPLTYFNNDCIFFGDEKGYHGGPFGILSSPRSLTRYIN